MSDFSKKDQRKLEKVLKKDLEKTERRANEAASKYDDPEKQARAFADELRKDGVDIDMKEIKKKFDN